MTVDLHKGDMLYIPQMWWQHVTLLAGHNLFVQFLWPSRISRNSNDKSTSETKGNLPVAWYVELDILLLLTALVQEA